MPSRKEKESGRKESHGSLFRQAPQRGNVGLQSQKSWLKDRCGFHGIDAKKPVTERTQGICQMARKTNTRKTGLNFGYICELEGRGRIGVIHGSGVEKFWVGAGEREDETRVKREGQ